MDSGFLQMVDPDLGPDAGCPTSSRIIQDITWCMGAHLLTIIDVQGTMVPNPGSWSGHRRLSGVDLQGGTRVKMPNPPLVWIHDDKKNAAAAFPPNKM